MGIHQGAEGSRGQEKIGETIRPGQHGVNQCGLYTDLLSLR